MRTLLILAFLSVPCLASAEAIRFTTEEYPPFSYREGKDIKGSSVDQVRKVMDLVGIDYTIDLMPWARAYAEAQNTPMTCVFTTAHNEERDKVFKWVEPILVDRNILIKHSSSNVTAANLDEAKSYVVGTWREDYTEKVLRNDGFSKIDVANDFKATLKKLLSDRIDLMPIAESYFAKLKQDGNDVEKVTVLSEQPLGIACRLDFPTDIQQRMQAALDRLIADGTQKAIYRKYGLQPAN